MLVVQIKIISFVRTFVRTFVRDKNTFKYVNVNIKPYLNTHLYE